MSTVNSHLFHQTVARRESASCETSRSAPCCSSAGRRCAYVCWSPWTQLKTVQKYAVVDANGVFAPSGATWGNVGRFPGALGGPPDAPKSEPSSRLCGESSNSIIIYHEKPEAYTIKERAPTRFKIGRASCR